MKFNYEELFNEVGLSDQERAIISNSSSESLPEREQAKVVADLYAIKVNKFMVDKLIESNEKLAVANSKYSKSLNILTSALVIVGLLQIIFNFFLNK